MARPVAIEVRNVHKEFHISAKGSASARERLVHPLRHSRGRQLRVLDDISFDVQQGEFFAIVGRNGSGKSTLLKMLASIYRADRGVIRIAGRLAPFIELGVGFHPDLAAHDNIAMNGVMMGLTPREARYRSDEIIAFAGLEDFTDLKLRNYSSGMRVRLGFSVMAHVDADVLLIDEVLAVGDAAFQEKSGEVFMRMHNEGRTIVLVTHDMNAVNMYSDRALLLNEGKIDYLGDPEETANRYLQVNFFEKVREAMGQPSRPEESETRIADVELEDATGARNPTFVPGEQLELHAVVDIGSEVMRPGFRFNIHDQLGRTVFVAPTRGFVDPSDGSPLTGRVHVHATIENRLGAGKYMLTCGVMERVDGHPEVLASRARWLKFEVSADGHQDSILLLDHDVQFQPDVAEGVSTT